MDENVKTLQSKMILMNADSEIVQYKDDQKADPNHVSSFGGLETKGDPPANLGYPYNQIKAEEGGGQAEHYSNMTTENTVIKSKEFGNQEGIVEEKEIKIQFGNENQNQT